jgi:hypothetical protein
VYVLNCGVLALGVPLLALLLDFHAALEAMYSGANESPIATLTREMSRTSLEPLAANAAGKHLVYVLNCGVLALGVPLLALLLDFHAR